MANIKDILVSVYSNVVEKEYGDLGTGFFNTMFVSNNEEYMRVAKHFFYYEEWPFPKGMLVCKNTNTNKWFLKPKKWDATKSSYYLGLNLQELALSDDEKFDTLEDLKKHYGLEGLGEGS